MAAVTQTTYAGNGVDHAVPPVIDDDSWDRPPQRPAKAVVDKRNRREWDQAWDLYFKSLRTIRGCFGKRTMGSDQRMAGRAARVAKAFLELSDACARLGLGSD